MKDVIRLVFLSQEKDGRSCCDPARIVEYVERALTGERVALDYVADPFLATHVPHLVLLHHNSPDRSYEERVAMVTRRWPDVPIVGVIGKQGCVDMLAQDLPAALRDFIVCPLDGRELALRVRRVLSQDHPPARCASGQTRRVRINSLVGESEIFQAQV